MEKYEVKLYCLSRKTDIQAVVSADEGETSDDIILEMILGDITVTATAESYFSAYQQLRDKLLQNGYGLQCNGSLINAHQSPMMAFVPKVYLVQIGKQALLKEIVGIWEYCNITDFPNTQEQNQYTEKWFESVNPKL